MLILLAEDNPINQRVTQLIVNKLGYRVDIVSDGCQALAAVERGDYSLVLMDVEMPKMDGITATRSIRARFSECERPYIIALTASAEREDCLQAGMNNFLSKPVRIEQLADAIEEALSTAAGWRDDCLSSSDGLLAVD